MGSKLSDKSAMTTWAAADQMHVLASGADYRMTLEDLFTEIVVSPVIKNSNGIDIDTTGGTDDDVDLITCLVSDTPKFWWDESADSFALSKGLLITGNVSVGGTTPRQAFDVTGQSIFGAADGNNIYINGDSVNTHYETDANAAMYINYYGYNNGTTQFRDLYICDGKGATVILVDGSAGNVGIGTAAPSAKLHIVSSTGIAIDTTDGSDADVDLITCLVTGSPKIWWDESEDKFALSKGLILPSYERHIQIDAKADGTVANQPTQVDFFTVGGLQFPATGAKYAYCQWEIPDDWDGGNVYFEIDWFPDSGATSGTDTVEWTIEYRAIAEGEAINNGTSKTLTSTDSGDYAQYVTKHARVTLAYNDADQPLTKQDHVYFKISRNASVTNDFSGSVTVAAYEIIYNSLGVPTSN